MSNEPSKQDWINRALAGDPIWQLGQIDRPTERALNRLVRQGELRKHRVRFMGISPLKTVWCKPGHEDQDILAAEYARQNAA